MNTTKYFSVFTFLILLLSSCEEEKKEFPTDKRYWGPDDYHGVVLELNFGYEADEKLPTLNGSENSLVVKKLVDTDNFKVVLEDEELGLKYKNEFATRMFDEWQDMEKIYTQRDRKDNYIYEMEKLAVSEFGLELQLLYFRLGNDEVIESADDPDSRATKGILRSNEQTVISNYLLYMDEINDENSYSEKGQAKLAYGISAYFPKLMEAFPEANYSKLVRKTKLMIDKTSNDQIKSSLEKVLELAEAMDNNVKVSY